MAIGKYILADARIFQYFPTEYILDYFQAMNKPFYMPEKHTQNQMDAKNALRSVRKSRYNLLYKPNHFVKDIIKDCL